ncbi:hypothetical protein QYF36_005824 [Acer negundo]|nr:hypothetical protein QYF36_005824 [Acer negundo]
MYPSSSALYFHCISNQSTLNSAFPLPILLQWEADINVLQICATCPTSAVSQAVIIGGSYELARWATSENGQQL